MKGTLFQRTLMLMKPLLIQSSAHALWWYGKNTTAPAGALPQGLSILRSWLSQVQLPQLLRKISRICGCSLPLKIRMYTLWFKFTFSNPVWMQGWTPVGSSDSLLSCPTHWNLGTSTKTAVMCAGDFVIRAHRFLPAEFHLLTHHRMVITNLGWIWTDNF